MCKQFIVSVVVTLVACLLGPMSALAGDTTITTQVFSGGATNAWTSDSSYHLWGTFRHTAIRLSTGGSYSLETGFWPYVQSLGPCRIGIRGNVDGDPYEPVVVADLTYLVAYLFQSGPPPSSLDEGNVDGEI